VSSQSSDVPPSFLLGWGLLIFAAALPSEPIFELCQVVSSVVACTVHSLSRRRYWL